MVDRGAGPKPVHVVAMSEGTVRDGVNLAVSDCPDDPCDCDVAAADHLQVLRLRAAIPEGSARSPARPSQRSCGVRPSSALLKTR